MSWTQIEKQTAAYRRSPMEKSAAGLDKVLRRSQSFLEKLTLYFVRSIPDFSESKVVFALSEGGVYPKFSCRYEPADNLFVLNTVGVMETLDEWRTIVLPEGYDAEKQSREERQTNRLGAFRKELAKLPSQWLALLLLFREMGAVLNERNPEPRRTAQRVEHGVEELEYLRLLWAFSQLESMYSRLMGGNLRADMGICWFESKWVIGR